MAWPFASIGAALGRLVAARRAREPQYPASSRVPAVGRTLAGVIVTPDTAATVPAVWACLRYLSQSVGSLPWRVMRENGNAGEIARTHPVDFLLWKRPNPEWTAFQFRETLVHWALRWGNGYAEIERDGAGRPLALWPIHPDRVCVERDEAGRLVYEVNNGVGPAAILPAADMFHIRGFGDGPVGVNVMTYAAQSIGWARAAQLFGASFFGNGMHGDLVVQTKRSLTPEGLKEFEARLEERRGALRRWRKPFMLDADMEVKATSVDPEKGQFVETNQHLVEEVCRWFGVPPHKVMHLLRATFSNIEHQSIEVVQDSIMPWAIRFEQEADFKLFGPENRRGYYTKINLRGLLRGDFKSQQEGFEVMRRNGALSANEWRDLIDMGPLPEGDGGDKYVMQSNNTTLERIGEDLASPPPPALPKPSPAAPADPADDLEADPATAAAIERIEAMLGVVHVD